jgi:hypothetical protein
MNSKRWALILERLNSRLNGIYVKELVHHFIHIFNSTILWCGVELLALNYQKNWFEKWYFFSLKLKP